MDIRVTGRHLDITPPMRQHVEKRLAKLDHIFHNLLDSHAILFPEGDEFIADITVTGSHLTLHVRDRDGDMYAAVDRAVHKLERQVRRHKERISHKKGHQTHEERDMHAAEFAEHEWAAHAAEEDEVTVEVAAPAPELESQAPAGPMTLDEAIHAFEENGAHFFAFINHHSDDVDVLYRRADGHLGLISRA